MTAPPVADFGPLIISTDIDDEVTTALRTWMPTYLSRIEHERGLTSGFLSRPKDSAFANALESMEFLDHTLPAVLVTTSATETNPDRGPDSSYTAQWRVVVSCVVRGRQPAETRHIAALFEGSIRRLLLQELPTVSGIVHSLRWRGTNVAPVADRTNESRYLAAGITQFSAFTQNNVKEGVGPTVPDAPEYDPLALVESVTGGGLLTGIDIPGG